VGEPREAHAIIQENCIACGNCVQVCRQHAVLAS
jgi:NAD-dependent dihydropyrimidine dehydrogenase PreA subunit